MYIGWPVHVHDARVLANSDIYCQGEEETLFGNRTMQTETHGLVATEAMILSLIKGRLIWDYTGSDRKDG